MISTLISANADLRLGMNSKHWWTVSAKQTCKFVWDKKQQVELWFLIFLKRCSSQLIHLFMLIFIIFFYDESSWKTNWIYLFPSSINWSSWSSSDPARVDGWAYIPEVDYINADCFIFNWMHIYIYIYIYNSVFFALICNLWTWTNVAFRKAKLRLRCTRKDFLNDSGENILKTQMKVRLCHLVEQRFK